MVSAQYNDDNVFAKILNKEIVCDLIYEDEYAIAFYDIEPQAKKHIIVISKQKIIHFEQFLEFTPRDMFGFFQAVRIILSRLIHNGFRIVINQGRDGGQSVPHFHMHILACSELVGKICEIAESISSCNPMPSDTLSKSKQTTKCNKKK